MICTLLLNLLFDIWENNFLDHLQFLLIQRVEIFLKLRELLFPFFVFVFVFIFLYMSVNTHWVFAGC